jgi:hypothetical protein
MVFTGVGRGSRCSCVLLVLSLAACATYPDVMPPPPAPVEPAARRNPKAAAVFQRAPWELRDMPVGVARFHRAAGMLFPDTSGPFSLTDISVYDPAGNDVGFDYALSDYGGQQARAFVSVRVFLAEADAAQEWKTAVERLERRFGRGQRTRAIDLSFGQFVPAQQEALVAPVESNDTTVSVFAQTSLFKHEGWLVRFDVNCAQADTHRLQTEIRRLAASFIP